MTPTTGKENTMKKNTAMVLYDAFIGVEYMVRDIYREAEKRRLAAGLDPTDAQIAAMVGLQKSLGDALSAFRAEIGVAQSLAAPSMKLLMEEAFHAINALPEGAEAKTHAQFASETRENLIIAAALAITEVAARDRAEIDGVKQ